MSPLARSRLALCALCLCLAALPGAACQPPSAPESVAAHLQRSVVHAQPSAFAQGSAILWRAPSGDWYAVTCAHVAECAEKNQKGKKHFGPIWLTQINADPDKGLVESHKVRGDVIDYDDSVDLALLKLACVPPPAWGSVSWHEGASPPVGSACWHAGSPTGIGGAASITSGVVSFIGRDTAAGVMDQCSAPTFPGSSGGLIAGANGKAIGVLSGGSGETFSLYVPSRTVLKMLRQNGLVGKLVMPPAK